MADVVQCYAGYRGEEEPRRFRWGGREVEVTAVLDRWRSPDERGFLVRGDDGGLYRLRCAESTGVWKLAREERGPAPGGPPRARGERGSIPLP